MAMEVEICVQGIESVRAAARGGADRIELCEDLASGGVTPSAGMITVACQRFSGPVHVLIRPRAGDFVYSQAEFEVMRRDIEISRSCGASGMVLGLLNADRTRDRKKTDALIQDARPLPVTFHKAFDQVRDPLATLEELIELGVERILTSGTGKTAREGLNTLVELARRAAGRIIIMAGGQIGERDVPTLIGAGLQEIHVGSAAMVAGRTDPQRVRRIVNLARAGSGQPRPC